ncbi:MAG: hypothetical protein SVR08_18815, partial [Spirochaetota bacterium]|nr:hypothetical protein [Spirochaetota bacterium]
QKTQTKACVLLFFPTICGLRLDYCVFLKTILPLHMVYSTDPQKDMPINGEFLHLDVKKFSFI